MALFDLSYIIGNSKLYSIYISFLFNLYGNFLSLCGIQMRSFFASWGIKISSSNMANLEILHRYSVVVWKTRCINTVFVKLGGWTSPKIIHVVY